MNATTQRNESPTRLVETEGGAGYYTAKTIKRLAVDLHLVVPQRFFTHGQSATGDRHVYANRTRFIPNGLLRQFERAAWPAASPTQARAPSGGPKVDVRAKMRGMWR